jgi:hypothetical protein
MPREHQSPLVPEAHEEFQAKKETTSSEKKDTSVFEVSEDISPSTWQGIEYSRRGYGGNFQKFVGEKPAGTYVFETTRSLVGDGGRREPVAAVVREGDVLTVLHTALVSGLDGTSRAELVVQGASRKQLQRESGFGLSFATLKNDQVNYEGMKREQDRHLADPVFISEHVYQPGHFRDMLLQTIDALQDGNVNKITLPTSGAGSGVASVLDLLQDRRAIIGVRDARVPDVPAEDLTITIVTPEPGKKYALADFKPKTDLGRWFQGKLQSKDDLLSIIQKLHSQTGEVVRGHLVKRLAEAFPDDVLLGDVVSRYDTRQQEKKQAQEKRKIAEAQLYAKDAYAEYVKLREKVLATQKGLFNKMFGKKIDSELAEMLSLSDETALDDVGQLAVFRKKIDQASKVLKNHLHSLGR